MTHINYITAAYSIAFLSFFAIIVKTSLAYMNINKKIKLMLKQIDAS